MVFGFGSWDRDKGGAKAGRIPTLPGAKVSQEALDTLLAIARAPRRQSASPSHRAYPSPQLSDRRESVPKLTPQEQVSLAQAPRRDGRVGPVDVGSAIGKLWNAPNTILGLGYGSLGHVAGEVAHAVNSRIPRPKIVVGDNAVQFRDNPFGGVSAITLGNTSTYAPGYDKPETVRHEKQHTYQGEQLGPFYIPANIAGGLNALVHGEDWHGDHNFMERGPQMPSPEPWRGRTSR